jgi:hypothetical protein
MSIFCSPSINELSINNTTDISLDINAFVGMMRNRDNTNSLAKSEMIEEFRRYCRAENWKKSRIDELEANYKSTNAIEWYTKDLFMYRLLNKAFRTSVILLCIFINKFA